MNIKGIGSHNVINLYNKNSNKIVEKEKIVKSKDTIEISNIGKSLNEYAFDDVNIDNTKKIAEIKSKIEKGTYNVDAKLTAQSIIDVIKGRRV
ncbi:flagellar biosynthesis anti-sigma factor FlgM [Clostridium sp. SHJSY1]|uniref:flagellar biosynthesis anti-sigma factor FlgM n=1 Tax=Clostridium sp. SHJSY1 TaxID=2942483 RepID=UPI0028747CF8|nr:flagellar biosynthesis anti-sigma factor FlgM [Clostridium sp. SHJSY1]MDS0524126.1 flagellar biosynthesis anti-sigma factor FlgM [Clostridium sp. SHJSY1]